MPTCVYVLQALGNDDAQSEGEWQQEPYEESEEENKRFSKFRKALDREPTQCIRYVCVLIRAFWVRYRVTYFFNL